MDFSFGHCFGGSGWAGDEPEAKAEEQPINRGHNKVVGTTGTSAKVTKIRGYQSSNRCSVRRCCHWPLNDPLSSGVPHIFLARKVSSRAHDRQHLFPLGQIFFPLFFFFWHKPGNKLSDTKSSRGRSQNKGINTRWT